MLNLRQAQSIFPIPLSNDRRTWDGISPDVRRELLSEADEAVRNSPRPLSAALTMTSPEEYQSAYAEHRARLDALIAGACVTDDGRYAHALLDEIWMLLECSGWCDPSVDNPSLPDIEDPRIDASAAQTACSLAIAAQILAPQLESISPKILPRIARELQRRVIVPLSAERTFAICIAPKDRLPAFEALLSTALLTDAEGEERWLCIRYLCELIEKQTATLPRDGGMRGGLEQYVRDACALANIFYMLSIATDGAVELRDEAAFMRMVRMPLRLHVTEAFFLNPGGESPAPNISRDALFLLGDAGRSADLCALAAFLNRNYANRPPKLWLMDTLRCALYRNVFLREPARIVQYPTLRIASMQLLGARMGSFYAAVLGGANAPDAGHLDVGDFTLFYRDRPIIIAPGGCVESSMHSVPEVEAHGQQFGRGEPPSEADCRFDSDLTLLSVGIAHAYPAAASLLGWQRSVMMTPQDDVVRLMDVVDFERGQSKRLTFVFMTPYAPQLGDGEILLDQDVLLTWEGALIPSVERVALPDDGTRRFLGASTYRIRLETDGPVLGGQFLFLFEPAT